MHHPDQKYIDALVNNDSEILEELYRKYSGKIKAMVLRNQGDENDAADIFQDALMSIFDRAKKEPLVLTCPFDAFLYLICRNKWSNELQKRKTRRVTVWDPDGYNIGEDCFAVIHDEALHHSRKLLLNKTIDGLDENCKRLLWLNWNGTPLGEVAKKLNWTYGYARKKKSECLAKIITLVKDNSLFNSLKR